MSSEKLNLSDFSLSEKTGALPEGALEKLPSYFDEWNSLADQFSHLWQEKKLRDEILKLPLLDHTKLASRKERILAHLQLSLFCTGYIFQDENRATSLPESVAVPLHGVSESLGIQPYTSYCTLFLGNLVVRNPEGPVTKDNLKTIIVLPGDTEWCCFLETIGQIEATAGPMLSAVLTGLEAVEKSDAETLAECLTVIKQRLDKMKDVFKQINDGCTPEAFNVFCTLFSGSGKGQPNPNGIIFEGVSDIPREFINTNASQTPVFQIIDGFLGIQHSAQNDEHLEFIKTYMLPDHRRIIEEVKKRSNVRQFVTSQDNGTLTSTYDECLSSLTKFRSFHIQMVTRYAVNQMSPEMRSAFTADKPGPMKFIKTVRDTTKTSEINNPQ